MTPEEIIAMAKEARISEMGLNIDGSSDLLGLFERFAALVAAKERERLFGLLTNAVERLEDSLDACIAAAIRARDRNPATGVVTGGEV